MPVLTKQKAYKVLNPVIKQGFPRTTTRKMVDKIISKNAIKHLEIGGAVPVDGYLVVHLSSVEVYGIPRKREKGLHYIYDFQNHVFQKEQKTLTNAFTLNYDLMGGIPISDNLLEGINMSHFLEHFTREEGLEILKECWRVLRPGATLRISCPDLRKYAEAYLNKDDSYFQHPLVDNYVNYEGLSSYGDLLIHKAYDGHNGHKWFYDSDSAIKLAQEAGFRHAVEKELHETNLPHAEVIEPAYRQQESFYIEAYK